MPNNNKIGAMLKSRRLSLNLTLEEVGDAVGVNKSTVKKWEDGFIENMRRDKIAVLAEVLKISPVDIIRGSSSIPNIKNIGPVPETYTVPRLGTIACGSPIFAEENFDGSDEVPVEIPDVSCTLICRGDSMKDARINDGDIVYIREQPIVDNGQIAAILIDDEEATLKRFYRDGDTVTLVAANPAYPPMSFKGPELERIRILGLAVAFTSRIGN